MEEDKKSGGGGVEGSRRRKRRNIRHKCCGVEVGWEWEGGGGSTSDLIFSKIRRVRGGGGTSSHMGGWAVGWGGGGVYIHMGQSKGQLPGRLLFDCEAQKRQKYKYLQVYRQNIKKH